jgi:hypothetical protein
MPTVIAYHGSVGVDVGVCCVELFIGNSGELDADANCHGEFLLG